MIAGSAGFQGFANNESHQQIACIMSLVLAVLTKLLYYELQAEQKKHALRRSKMSGLVYTLSHSVLFCSLAAMGSLLHDVSAAHEWDSTQRAMFPVFSSLFLLSISILSLSHEGVGRGLRVLKKEVRVGVRISFSVVLMLLGIVDFMSHCFSDCEHIGIVVGLFSIDFAVEFHGSKFSKIKCGCSKTAERPCLQRIVSEQIALKREQSAINPMATPTQSIDSSRISSIDGSIESGVVDVRLSHQTH